MLWYIKQLLPLSYESNYKDSAGKKHHTEWRMWFGKCFNIEDTVLN